MSLSYPHLTYYDATDRVLDAVVGGDSSPRSRRLAADAIRRAYAELMSRKEWKCYLREFLIQTVASQTSGTIAYDYTGGSSERLVTLTSSTFPTDANKYALIVSGKRYGIDTYLSSTTITLQARDCPTADLDAGTSYTLTRDTYDLPADFLRMDFLYDMDAPGRMLPVQASDIMRERRLVRGTAVPRLYAVFRDEQYSSSMALHFAPSCGSIRRYQAYGKFAPSELRVLDYSGIGTVSLTANSTTITGTSTTFTQDHVGCVIRVSPDAKTYIPTSIIGDVTGNRLQPYAEQGVIRSVESTTSATLEIASSQTLSGCGYRVSSRVDIEPNAMRNAFLRLAEALYSPQDRAGARDRLVQYERELQVAMWADTRQYESPGPTWLPTTLADVAASVDASGN